MQVADFGHLTYCTNIHPGENWETTFDSLKAYVPKIKTAVAPNTKFGLGLRLSNVARQELAPGENLPNFKKWLDANGLYVFTMNGFPYGNFHKERVKDNVHAPDWTTPERLHYTQRLFKQLAVLLPEGMDGGISTSPISYKHWHKTPHARKDALQKGAMQLLEIALQLYELENNSGMYLHLDIEPEPDGLIENSDEVLHFFQDYLVPIGRVLFQEYGIEADKAEELIKRYLTICYDVCHFALAYEEPEVTFEKFKSHGINVGKLQISAALKVLSQESNIDSIWSALEEFNEPTYLHQVTTLKDGVVVTYPDLPVVLDKKDDFKEMRAHFHVPIFLEKFTELYSTQDHIIKVLTYLKHTKVSGHLEVETYTWDVLPAALKLELSESIIREINWFKIALLR